MIRISSKLIPACDFNVDCKAQYEENEKQQSGQPVTIKIKDRLQEKRHTVQRQSAEIKDLSSKIGNFRVREDEYESKIKNLWSEQEKKSKAYQKDIQAIHENYRGVTSTAAEMEARLNMYKSDWEKATQAERTARQEVLKLTFQNDELTERHKYMERKYLQLVQRVGASAEDLEAVEIIMANG